MALSAWILVAATLVAIHTTRAAAGAASVPDITFDSASLDVLYKFENGTAVEKLLRAAEALHRHGVELLLSSPEAELCWFEGRMSVTVMTGRALDAAARIRSLGAKRLRWNLPPNDGDGYDPGSLDPDRLSVEEERGTE